MAGTCLLDIVFRTADIDAAVKGAIANKFLTTLVQARVLSVNRFYIQETVYDKFVNQLADAVKALKVGNGLTRASLSCDRAFGCRESARARRRRR
ncbi:aldehyde dehydrogenase family protein [Shigella flexneri]